MGNIVWLKNATTVSAWNTASNWVFWNEQTQQIEDYGQAPNGDDYVYLNSYIVSVSSNTTLSFPNGTITNKPNPYTGLTGGRFDNGANGSLCTIISNLEVGETYMLRHGGNGGFTFNITGNITGSDSAVVYNKGGNNGAILNVTGNIYGGSQPLMSGNTGSSLTIVGDVYLKNGVGSNVTVTLKINGSLHLDYTTFTSATVAALDTEGDIYLTSKKLGSCTNWINRGTSIYYKGLNPLGGFCNYTNLDLRYPDDFVVKDIDEPRVNPLIIETNWDFANEVQYPPENRVVAGTPYAFDQKVGTFGVDYPPETVVLKGYEYDGGEMVGTYEGGGTVQNTINVYPYKKRNDY